MQQRGFMYLEYFPSSKEDKQYLQVDRFHFDCLWVDPPMERRGCSFRVEFRDELVPTGQGWLPGGTTVGVGEAFWGHHGALVATGLEDIVVLFYFLPWLRQL